MTREQELDLEKWSAGEVDVPCCTPTRVIQPEAAIESWSVTNTCCEILANADAYYTGEQVDEKLKDISGMSPSEVEEIVDSKIRDKADQSEVDELSRQVAANTQAILERATKTEVNELLQAYYTKIEVNELLQDHYTKTEVDDMFNNYSKVEGTTLELHANNNS